MATATAAKKPQALRVTESSIKKMAGDYPRYMVGPDGEWTELTHRERALIRLSNALPADLLAEFDELLLLRGDAFDEGLAKFHAKLAPRRNELVGW